MRHRRHTDHLNRNAPHARALLRNLTVSVLTHQQVTTTIAKARAARPFVEHVITLGKTGNLHARRQAIALLGNAAATRRLFVEIAPLFKARQGGYTRIVRLGTRRGDGAMLALLELTERLAAAPPTPTPGKKEKTRAPTKHPEVPSKPAAQAAPEPPSKTPVPAPSKPRRLFDGLRGLWGRRQGDRGGGRG